LWDLGEFNQKNTTRTKWGTFQELKTLSQVAQSNNVLLYFDAVLNQKAAADATEQCRAIQVDPNGDSIFSLI
jgi:alpha-amylase